jgi:hypothetical protein
VKLLTCSIKWFRTARVILSACALCTSLAPASARADDGESLLDALDNTMPLIDLRLRSEDVGEFGKDDSAEAVTLRGRFGFETGEAWDTSLLAEGVALTPLDSDYNSTVNGKTQYPTVADPETYGLNRLQLENQSIPDTTLVAGRQVINLDDQRFIGSVNWRQLEQTFDAVQAINTTIPDVTIDLAYLNRINRIYGQNSPQGVYRGDNYLGNVALQTPYGKLVGFAYVLDFDIDPKDSTRTYGARYSGDRMLGEFKIGYSASYAGQTPNANNPLHFSNDYYEGELSAEFHGLVATAGDEVLSGNGVKGFTTPLATLHSFDGWAEQFLTDPVNGIDDRYGSIGYTMRKVFGVLDSLSATGVFHDFHSERLSLDYGSEIDGQLKATWRDFTLLLEYADYTARQYSTDTHKLWMEVDYVLQ